MFLTVFDYDEVETLRECIDLFASFDTECATSGVLTTSDRNHEHFEMLHTALTLTELYREHEVVDPVLLRSSWRGFSQGLLGQGHLGRFLRTPT